MNKRIDTEDLDKKFEELLSEDKMNIDSIENLLINEVEAYKNELKSHIEELLTNKLKEKELINKKRRNAKKEFKTEKYW